MFIELETVDSTNKYVRENLDNLDDYSIVFAHHQTRGRGRISRFWFDDKNSITASLLIKDVKGELKHLSLIVAYAIFKTIKELDIDCKIKWPNDIYIGDKKVCGVLIETILSDKKTAIIGFGINTNTKAFPDNTGNPTSIYLEKNILVDNIELAKKVSNLIIDAYLNTPFEEIVRTNRDNAYLMNRRVRMNYYGDGIEGVVVDLDESGNIIIDTGIEKISVFSGELTLLKD